jgi:xanthine dehydrogenase accessory factor
MWNWISRLEELRSAGTPVVAVTVTGGTGSTPREAGAKMLVLATGECFGTIGGGHLEELAIADARRCLEAGESRTIRYPLGAKTGQCCGGVVDLFFEVIGQGPRLYLFGAGHVGQAVCRTLSGTPFSVHVVDERKGWIRGETIPGDAIRHECEWDAFAEEAEWHPERTYVAIMTHRHDVDQEIVAHAVRKPARYIGLIGSEAKWGRFRQRLAQRGFTEDELARVKCPIGLDVGGKAPQEVAISLAGELLGIHYGRA